MKYFKESKKEYFYKLPSAFNKYSKKELLKYALGANLYMNGMKDCYSKIVNGEFREMGTITICFEDATREDELEISENNILNMLDNLYRDLKNGELTQDDIPLIFIRVRNTNQFINFSNRLKKSDLSVLSGFVFPKFNCENGKIYLEHTKYLSDTLAEKLYIMPILETEKIIYKESRINELVRIKKLLSNYSEMVLNIRVGGTDFSSKFGLRRSVYSSIYDIKVVSDCLIDIINIFLREGDEHIISGAVWEYFSDKLDSNEVKGLINELRLDRENGFCGKTVIHPKQVDIVNAYHVVSFEEYIDSKDIISNANMGGVFKGCNDNKMNEVLPHLNWAKKILCRAEVFGVLNKGIEIERLYKKG